MEDCQRTGILDSNSKLYKTLSDLRTVLCGRGCRKATETHQRFRNCNSAPQFLLEKHRDFQILIQKISPNLLSAYFLCEKNTCLQAMPTLSVLEKWVPSLTQRQNYAWQPSRSAKQAGLYTIPGTRISRRRRDLFQKEAGGPPPCPLGSPAPTNSQS